MIEIEGARIYRFLDPLRVGFVILVRVELPTAGMIFRDWALMVEPRDGERIMLPARVAVDELTRARSDEALALTPESSLHGRSEVTYPSGVTSGWLWFLTGTLDSFLGLTGSSTLTLSARYRETVILSKTKAIRETLPVRQENPSAHGGGIHLQNATVSGGGRIEAGNAIVEGAGASAYGGSVHLEGGYFTAGDSRYGQPGRDFFIKAGDAIVRGPPTAPPQAPAPPDTPTKK